MWKDMSGLEDEWVPDPSKKRRKRTLGRKDGGAITIERARRVWRGEELYLFRNCDRTELSMLFDIVEKRKAGDSKAAASAYDMFKRASGDLLEWSKVEEALRVLGRHTIVRENTVYDKMTDGNLARRYE